MILFDIHIYLNMPKNGKLIDNKIILLDVFTFLENFIEWSAGCPFTTILKCRMLVFLNVW